MFTTLFVLAYCCSLAGSLSVDPISNEKYIDGSQHTIKSVGTTYKQHISDHGMYSCRSHNELVIDITVLSNRIYREFFMNNLDLSF
jgi:hypothetical protein